MQVQVELESRKCQNCGSQFRVMNTSSQKVCSTSCQMFGLGAPVARPNPLREEKPARESVTVNATVPTKSFGKRKHVGLVPGIWETKRVKNKDQKIITKSIGRPEMRNEQSGAAEIVNDSARYSGFGMKETKNKSLIESTPSGTSKTPSVGSTKPSPNVELVGSQSMNLLDSTAEHLYGLMRGLHANQPEPEIKTYDPDRVNAACNCAKNIREIMKLKLDAIKVQMKLGE